MTKLNQITDVFFDLDHTLWDFEKNSELTFEKIFQLNNINVSLDDFLAEYVPINLNYWKLYREERITKEELRFARLNATFTALKIPVAENQIVKLSNDYIKYLPTFNHLIADAVNVLEYLNNNYTLHIITNGFDEVQQKKLDGSHITKYFKTITNSEIAGVKKPNPKIFQYALKSAEADVSSSVMIGDSFEADIEGALNIGMSAVYFEPNQTEKGYSVHTISSLIELKALF
ncbi:YjjG family noncanonical pyrimidine nucleotidase [Flavobacteriaceae bacterium MHTCC 0001]